LTDSIINILSETDTHLFWEEEGIICIKYKVPVIDLEVAKSGLATRNKITGYKPSLVFADCSLVTNLTSDARTFYASESNAQTTTALAALATSGLTKIIGNFFLSFHCPKVPCKLFSSKEKAFAWLHEHNDH